MGNVKHEIVFLVFISVIAQSSYQKLFSCTSAPVPQHSPEFVPKAVFVH